MATIQDDVVRLEKADGSRKLVTTDCVYDLTEDKTQEAVNSEIKNTLTHLETETSTIENGLAIIVEGNSCATGASQDQYVYLKDSTISGFPDGLYTAAQAIPANTAIDGTYLSSVSDGGLNSLKNSLVAETLHITYTTSELTGGVEAHRSGRTITVAFAFTATGTIAGNATFARVPAECSPQYPIRFAGSQHDAFRMFYINASGEIKCFNAIDTAWTYGSVTYVY